MSLDGSTPHFLVCSRRTDGLIDYALFNPRGWSGAELVHRSHCAARDVQQALGRVQDLKPPWQEDINIRWVDATEFQRRTAMAVLPTIQL